MTPTPNRPTVIARRKACRPTGVGLSHYVLLTNTTSRTDPPNTANAR